MDIDLKELAKFLIKAKIQTYAGEGKETVAQRPGFKELEFKEGNWKYRDSYAGFFMAPGQEIVRFNEKIIWAMAYSGGMKKKFHKDLGFAKRVFDFLKNCLKKVTEEKPYRGPENLREEKFEYINETKGDITDFKGTERIFYKGEEVFTQNYIGGLVISK